jgi:hypothetical protein
VDENWFASASRAKCEGRRTLADRRSGTAVTPVRGTESSKSPGREEGAGAEENPEASAGPGSCASGTSPTKGEPLLRNEGETGAKPVPGAGPAPVGSSWSAGLGTDKGAGRTDTGGSGSKGTDRRAGYSSASSSDGKGSGLAVPRQGKSDKSALTRLKAWQVILACGKEATMYAMDPESIPTKTLLIARRPKLPRVPGSVRQ